MHFTTKVRQNILLVPIALLLAMALSTYGTRQDTFYATGGTNCITFGTNRGIPFGFLKTSSTSTTFGERCIQNNDEARSYNTLNPAALFADLILWFGVIYLMIRLVMWRISSKSFAMSRHILAKATIVGIAGSFIGRLIVPPQHTVLGSLGTGLAVCFGFLLGFVVAAIVLFGMTSSKNSSKKV
jgi:hypothetical protein